jgi:phosphopantothenoylcysteine synthetase/decarboxylase
MRFLVTAGGTWEKIDSVRQWGNVFTGNTGLGIAKALATVGEVDLLSSNEAHLQELRGDVKWRAIHGSCFRTHGELKGGLEALMARQSYDAVFMTAAVADYKPVGVYRVIWRRELSPSRQRWMVEDAQAQKVKSRHDEIAVLAERTEKLVDLFRSVWNFKGILVKFKLEVGITPEELLPVAEQSRRASAADYIVANTLEMVSGPEAGAYVLGDTGHEWVRRQDLPARMVGIVTQ